MAKSIGKTMVNDSKQDPPAVEGEHIPAESKDIALYDDDTHLKSHSMVFSAIDLTQKMQDMMALMFNKMTKADWENSTNSPVYSWSSEELQEWFGVDSGHLAATLQNPSKNLANRSAGFEQENGDFEYIPLLKRISYSRGFLTMVPNDELKKHYVVALSDGGFAKIDNKVFLALNNPNSKRVFEFLCRFRGEFELYPISVERMQLYFGVRSDKGKILKKTYASERQFIRRIIEPSLKEISTCPEATSKLELIKKDGLLGYELSEMANGKLKIKFNIKWKTAPLDKDKRLEIIAEADKLMVDYRDVVARGGDGVELLKKVSRLLASIAAPVAKIDAKIASIEQERETKEREANERKLKELEDKLFSSFDDL